MYMQSVTDQLRRHIVPLSSRPDHAGSAVMDRRHPVEQVGQMGGPGFEAVPRLLIGGIGMRHRNPAKRRNFPYECLCAMKLRRDIHNTDQAAAFFLKIQETVDVRKSQIRAVLRALSLFRKIRALHMDPGHPGRVMRAPLHIIRRCLKHSLQSLIRKRHGCGCK